jgi:hypothetical protein
VLLERPGLENLSSELAPAGSTWLPGPHIPANWQALKAWNSTRPLPRCPDLPDDHLALEMPIWSKMHRPGADRAASGCRPGYNNDPP